jgi:hypothetical protein
VEHLYYVQDAFIKNEMRKCFSKMEKREHLAQYFASERQFASYRSAELDFRFQSTTVYFEF